VRSRPAVEVRYLTPRPTPGSTLEVELLLRSPSKTPVDEVLLTLSGGEYLSGRVPPLAARHVSLAAQWKPGELTRGTHKYRAHFALPAVMPPSYRGVGVTVLYTLDLHVDIPWWPDVDKSFVVPVYPLPLATEPAGPGLFNNRSGDAAGAGAYAELSMDRTDLEPGGVLTGVVSVARAPGVRELTLSFVQREWRNEGGGAPQYEVVRYTARVGGESPDRGDGAPAPFRVQLPAGASPTFRGVFCGCEWTLELAAAGRFSDAVLLRIPFKVRPLGSAQGSNQARTAPPAVGSERRARLWEMAAQRVGGSYDPADDVLYAATGGVSVRLHTEQRSDGPFTVVGLRWPPLHIQLEVQNSGGLSRLFKRDLLKTSDPDFDKAFEARGREEAQVLAVLTPAVRAALRTLPVARVDDEGARFETPGAGVDAAALDRLVDFAMGVARRFSEAIEAVPAPTVARGWVPAWRSFASRVRGRFEPGRVWVEGGDWGGRRVSLGISWRNATTPDCTTLRVALERPLEQTVSTALNDPSGAHDRDLSEGIRGALAELRAKGSLGTGDNALVFVVDGAVEDPASMEVHVEALTRVARVIEGGADRGPFR
jgi:hypothetical protein